MSPLRFRLWHKSRCVMVDERTPDYRCGHLAFSGRHVLADPTDFEIMQSTGLTDRSGKEIFEGDVIDGRDANGDAHRGEVTFESGTFCLRSLSLNWNRERETVMVWKDGINRWHSLENLENFDIIGNIYENPRLLPNPD